MRWWPGWYVDRLHAVSDGVLETIRSAPALCGRLYVYPPTGQVMQNGWQAKRLATGVPKCKHCLRIAAPSATTKEPTDE